LDAMYKGFNTNDEITVWCEGKQSCEDTGKKRRGGNQIRQAMEKKQEMHLSVLEKPR